MNFIYINEKSYKPLSTSDDKLLNYHGDYICNHVVCHNKKWYSRSIDECFYDVALLYNHPVYNEPDIFNTAEIIEKYTDKYIEENQPLNNISLFDLIKEGWAEFTYLYLYHNRHIICYNYIANRLNDKKIELKNGDIKIFENAIMNTYCSSNGIEIEHSSFKDIDDFCVREIVSVLNEIDDFKDFYIL